MHTPWVDIVHFSPAHLSEWFIMVGLMGCLAGYTICRLTVWLPECLLKDWRIQSWQCIHPQQPMPKSFASKRCAPLPRHYAIGVMVISILLSLTTFAAFGVQPTTLVTLPLMWGLVLLACIDCKYHLLPDCLTLPLLWAGLLCNSMHLFVPLQVAIWGAGAGYISLWSVARLFKWLRGIEGIGQGDFKLLALFGAWWGYAPLSAIVMLASLLGATAGIVQLLRGRHHWQKPLAFGPCLIFAAIILYFCPDRGFFIDTYATRLVW